MNSLLGEYILKRVVMEMLLYSETIEIYARILGKTGNTIFMYTNKVICISLESCVSRFLCMFVLSIIQKTLSD